MRHPTEGVLRRLVDEPDGVPEADRHHVADCPVCAAELATARDDAALVASALAVDTDVDVDAAWLRLTSTAPPERVVSTPRFGRSRRRVRRPLVAGLAAVVVLSGAGVAAANDWLEIFRTEKVAPLALETGDLNALPDLRAYGDVDVSGDPDAHGVPDAAAAEAETGLDVPEVATLPRGVSGEPEYQVGGEVRVTFSFDAERAGGEAPPGVDGSQVRFVAGPGVAAIWSRPGGPPSLLVARAVAPTASSTGVPFETVRDHLLSMPGLPEDVATRLRTFNADGSTLPLPLPADRVTTSDADVNGAPATVVTSRDRTVAAVVWVDDGVVTAVAGSLDADELLTVARELA